MPPYSRKTIALLLFAGWTLIALYFAVQASFTPAAPPRIPWSYALLVNFTYYYLWGLCTPLVVWLGRQYPFHTGRWAPALAVHVAASAAITAMQILAAEAVLASTGLRESSAYLSKLSFAF